MVQSQRAVATSYRRSIITICPSIGLATILNDTLKAISGRVLETVTRPRLLLITNRKWHTP